MTTVELDGCSLTLEDLVLLGDDPAAQITVSKAALEKVEASRKIVDEIVAQKRVVYGITTGFGKFATTIVADVEQLQLNLIRSHCAGVGPPLSPQRARRLFALRINVLAKGHSGIRPSTIETMMRMFNAGVVPYVPEQGTVGASGDLAPLSHLALGIIGEGKLATVRVPSWRPAQEVLASLHISPVVLKAKEGLSLINGTQFITSLGAEAVVRARNIARQADVVAALTNEALAGSYLAYDPQIHSARLHQGQNDVAARLRLLLHSPEHKSQINASHNGPTDCGKVQDAYSLRCVPQVHGVVNDILRFVAATLTLELNAATDNPLVFPLASEGHHQIISGGNFHGEYPAKMLDLLAIATTELANISERRQERLCNPQLSGLPAFLTPKGGIESGFMISHCTSAALVSENKVLCHPASIDTISTSAAQEDHVSMGGFAARKALKVVENVEMVLAIELMCAAQGIEFRRPLLSTPTLERVYATVRTVCAPWKTDRVVSVDHESLATLLRQSEIWNAVAPRIPPHLELSLPGAAPFAYYPTSRL